mgnify:CR=1 FL=1|jgi:prophage regulatory protein
MTYNHTSRTDWIRSDEIQSLVPYSLNHLRRLEAVGAFPKRVRIGLNRIAWVREEVEDWRAAKLGERGK